MTVAGVEPFGTLVVAEERGAIKSLSSSQRVLVRGYAVTSCASQGKTVNAVILADAGNRIATNAQQWYDGISRGRKRVVVFTPDKTELREIIQRSGDRRLALDHGAASNTAGSMCAREHAERMREYIELARRHQYFTQHLDRTQNVRQMKY